MHIRYVITLDQREDQLETELRLQRFQPLLRIRAAVLDRQLATRDEALGLARELAAEARRSALPPAPKERRLRRKA